MNLIGISNYKTGSLGKYRILGYESGFAALIP